MRYTERKGPPSPRIAGIIAACRGSTAMGTQAAGTIPPVKAASVPGKPASTPPAPKPAPVASTPPAPRQPRLSAAERQKIAAEVKAELAAEAKAKRQAEVSACWARVYSRTFSTPSPPAPQSASGRMWAKAYDRLPNLTSANA